MSMMSILTPQKLDTLIEACGIKNPFRYAPDVAQAFRLDPEESATGDIFRDFVRDELMEFEQVPHKALEYIADDLTCMLEALQRLDRNAISHSYFSPQQVCILQNYLGGDRYYVLGARDREEALNIVNEMDGDRFQRLMLAALDERNRHSPEDVEAMFNEGIEQMERAIRELEALAERS